MLGDVCRMLFWFGFRQDIIVKTAYFRVQKLMSDYQASAMKHLGESNYKLYRAHNQRVNKYIKEIERIDPYTDKFLPKP